MHRAVVFAALVVCLMHLCVADIDWTPVESIIQDGIKNRITPGVAALVANEKGILFAKGFGNFVYDDSTWPQTTPNTMFDVASLTKVLVTTTLTAILNSKGLLPLDTKISSLFPDFAQNGKQDITVLHLLLHNSGLPADPYPGYPSKDVGCVESKRQYPKLSFSCQQIIFENLMKQTMKNPVGQVYVYSDLSMITMMNVIGKIVKDNGLVHDSDVMPGCPIDNPRGAQQCYYEAFVRVALLNRLQTNTAGFLPSDALKPNCAPTANDTTWRKTVVQGMVHDPNAYAMGGVAGHAGFFSSVLDAHKILNAFMFDSNVLDIDPKVQQQFVANYNKTQSSRALGWDTNLNHGSSCGSLSERTYMHTGYTGTQTCNDPERKLITIFFTNRVWPNDSADVYKLRVAFNSMVQQVYDKATASSQH